MKNSRFLIFSAALLLLAAAEAPAVSFWRHPEIAGKNSLFADIALAPLVFYPEFKFPALPLELRLDWMPPLPLPFSAGLFMKTPSPNLNSFGIRLGYHADLGLPNLDLFFLYVFDFGFVRNKILERHGDLPVPVHYYDFRLGARYFFHSRAALSVESDFKVFGVIFMLSIKIF